MKKTALLNSRVSAVIAQMGHTDWITVGDAGLPIPKGTTRIDLAVSKGVPKLLEVLEPMLLELKVQKVIIATELIQSNKEFYDKIIELVGDVEVQDVPHEEFKALTARSKAVIRTGETTSYANVIFESGVVF